MNCLFLPFILFFTTSFTSHASAKDLNKELSRIITEKAIKAIDKAIPVKTKEFDGSLKASDPKKETSIDIEEFKLSNDTITLAVTAKSKLALNGKLGEGANAVDVQAKAAFVVSIAADFKLFEEGGKFFVEAKIKSLKLKTTVSDLAPSNLSGGSALITTIVNSAFKARSQNIIDDLNKKYQKIKINF